MKQQWLWLTAILLFAGCVNPVPETNAMLPKNSSRIEVVSAQVITDSRAYRRDILVLRDKESGREFVAVMGAGVTEMEQQGKVMVEQ